MINLEVQIFPSENLNLGILYLAEIIQEQNYDDKSFTNFYSYLVTQSGLSGPVVTSIGSTHNTVRGYMKTSPDGTKLVSLLYDEDKFTKYVNNNKINNYNKTTVGGVYMPILFKKDVAIKVGMYPEGNIAGANFNNVVDYGDRVFMRKLRLAGVNHITSWDSFAYHFQQGEMEA